MFFLSLCWRYLLGKASWRTRCVRQKTAAILWYNCRPPEILPYPQAYKQGPEQSPEERLRALIQRLVGKTEGFYFAPVFKGEDGSRVVLCQTAVAEFSDVLPEDSLTALLKGLEADPANTIKDPKVIIPPPQHHSPGGNKLNFPPSIPLCRVQMLRWHTRDGFETLEKTNALAEREGVLVAAPCIGSGVIAFHAEQPYYADFITRDYRSSERTYSYNQIWWLYGNYGINVPEAWGLTPGSPGITVAVIDRGSGPKRRFVQDTGLQC